MGEVYLHSSTLLVHTDLENEIKWRVESTTLAQPQHDFIRKHQLELYARTINHRFIFFSEFDSYFCYVNIFVDIPDSLEVIWRLKGIIQSPVPDYYFPDTSTVKFDCITNYKLSYRRKKMNIESELSKYYDKDRLNKNVNE